MQTKILITSSGTGSRLWELTRDTNKALIQVGWKEIIAHIIDSYPVDIPMIITLWYHGDKVKRFVQEKYPDRDIEFIMVDRFEWPWSSLGFSMLQARAKLQCPFIFHCNDTLVSGFDQSVETNWAAGLRIQDSSQYTTFKVDEDNNIVEYNTKRGATDFDYAHIWLVWILEYEKFFSILEKLYEKDPNNSSLNDVYVLHEMLRTGSSIKAIDIETWLDTGNLESLATTQEEIKKLIY